MNIYGKSRLYAALPILSRVGTCAEINTDALRRNYRTLTAGLPSGTEAICVVKADAYGHGTHTVVPILWEEGCRRFAVSCMEEAMDVRGILADADILILGYVPPDQAAELAAENLTVAALSDDYARALASEAVAAGVCVKVHIKLDTGMNRLGFPAYSVEDCRKTAMDIFDLSHREGLSITGIFSHFAVADEPDGYEMTKRQAARYLMVTSELERLGAEVGMRHLCNSAGALCYPEYAFDAVRFGLVLYGYSPLTELTIRLEPVMRLCSIVTHIHTLRAGEKVGYGATFCAPDERKIATVAIGYADGFLRAYGGAAVTFHTSEGDVRAKIVGRICMDQCMADVTGLPVSVGDRVTLFGDTGAELEELAARAGTIPYESLCLVSSRVPRIAVRGR